MQPSCIYVINNSIHIDFNLLACNYHELYPHLVILDYQTTIDFSNQKSLIALAEAIMTQIIGVKFWRCPEDSLCPRIPNRINYLMWVHRYSQLPNIRTIVDIGTGPTLIYPLLAKSIFNWKSIASESATASYTHAQAIIDGNNLHQHISLIKSDTSNILLGTIPTSQTADVCVCNPPFYEQEGEHQPLGTMLPAQFSTLGGEYEFFFEMYRQSFHYKGIRLFTCLIGRKSNFVDIVEFINSEHELGMLQFWKIGEIMQGRNIRSIVAWKAAE